MVLNLKEFDWPKNMKEYDRWTDHTSQGKVVQVSKKMFEYRMNTRPEITDWIQCSLLQGTFFRHKSFIGRILFDKPCDAAIFKIRWCNE